MPNIHSATEYLKFRLPLSPQKGDINYTKPTIYTKVSQCEVFGRLRIPKTLSGDLSGHNYFHNNTNVIFCLLCVDICTDGAKSKVTELLAS